MKTFSLVIALMIYAFINTLSGFKSVSAASMTKDIGEAYNLPTGAKKGIRSTASVSKGVYRTVQGFKSL